jgi:NAD-reducing hydrogenase small subunit
MTIMTNPTTDHHADTPPNGVDQPARVRLATAWLDGCSGCHMSFLDMDERLIALAEKVDLVYSPIMDIKECPEGVDLALVEGSVSSVEDLHKIKLIRARSKVLIALGDCAVTGNVPSMRNPFGVQTVLTHIYLKDAPNQVVPALLPEVRPIHHVVPVDGYLTGCPPSADVIFYALNELIAGRVPDLAGRTRFGK